jgi:hypothetical protein
MDASGRVRTRAPLWWLQQTIGGLTEMLLRSG